VASPDPKKNGCPVNADSDGDGILDAADACPHEKGPASADPKANGCPTLVRVREGEIALLAEVKFRVAASDPAPLDRSAEVLLGEVREVIAQHPEFVKIEVQAHTDSTGKADFNTKISTARAEAVRKWLVDHGVAAGRLVARGDRPLGDNKTAAGRKQNRRIQLVVLEKK
jgi:outer membrane protein OmpA-like peptidoglycan-associated protein